MHGGELVADCLARHGVRVVFTLIGGHISPILTAAKARGLRVIDVRDEVTAAFAADAVSRLTGAIGVAAVTAGPGVTNTITALKNAQLAQSPLLLLGGATATVLRGRGALQDVDQLALVRPHVKWLTQVNRVRELEPAISRALREAQTGVPGPVFVECPVDVLYPEPVVRELYFGGQPTPKGLSERVLRWYLERQVARVFAPAAAPADEALSVKADPVGDGAVRRLATHLSRAERPVLVIGSQAVGTGSDAAGLARAVTALGVPVFLSGMARGLLGASHPLQFRHQRKQALRESDLVVLAGTPCDFRLDYGRQIGRRTLLVSINRDGDDLRKNRRPDLGILAPPDRVLQATAEVGPAVPGREGWLDILRARERARDEDIHQQAMQPVSPLNPIALCEAVDECLNERSVVVADGGDFVATASYVVRPRAPLTWLDPGVFGSLGVGAGFVLGVHAARPGSEIWAIYGDGALGFSLAEFDTFVRHRVPVVAVVGNDGKWAQIARDQVAVLGDDVATQIGRAAYHRVVEGFGAKGLLVDDPSQVRTTLAEARRIANTGVPVLVNALIGDTNFRKGSISL